MSTRAHLGAGLACVVIVLAGGCGSSSTPTPDLAFVSSRDKDYAIYTMTKDGGHERRLTKNDAQNKGLPEGAFFQVDPAWSPDGRSIAFASRRYGTSDLFVMDADGRNTRRLTSKGTNETQPTWSPDGRLIAFAQESSGDIALVRADGTGSITVVSDPAADSEPAWSPDGHTLAYVHRAPGTESRELWLMNADGTRRRPLTHLSSFSSAPAWSADGRSIAFSSDTGNAGAFDIYVIRRDGAGLRRLTHSGGAYEPAWSADGSTIAFARDGAIVSIASRGGQVTALTDESNNDSSPAWRPVGANEQEGS